MAMVYRILVTKIIDVYKGAKLDNFTVFTFILILVFSPTTRKLFCGRLWSCNIYILVYNMLYGFGRVIIPNPPWLHHCWFLINL